MRLSNEGRARARNGIGFNVQGFYAPYMPNGQSVYQIAESGHNGFRAQPLIRQHTHPIHAHPIRFGVEGDVASRYPHPR